MMFLNFNKFKIIRIFSFFIILSILFLLILNFSYLTNKSSMVDFNGIKREINLPYKSISEDDKDFIFTTHIENKILNPKWIKIIPDDGVVEMKVNGQIVSLDIENKDLLWNWDIGFDYPIGQFLTKKSNTIEMKIKNRGGEYGLKIKPSYKDVNYVLTVLFFYIFAALLIFEILNLFKINKKINIILVAAILVRIFYFSVTDWDVRGHDADAHVDYIEYIVKHNSLPKSNEGWEFHQPPVYYVSAALVYKAANLVGIQSKIIVYKVLQFFSLIIDFGIMIVGFLIFNFIFKNLSLPGKPQNLYEDRRFLLSKKTNCATFRYRPSPFNELKDSEKLKENLILISFSLFALWPSHVVHSVRISNDNFLYLFYFLSFMFFLFWLETPKKHYLVLLLVSTFLAIFSKKSGIVIIPVFYLGIGFKFFLDENRFKNKNFYIKNLIVITIALTIIFGIVFHEPIYNNLTGKKENLMVGTTNNGLNPALFVDNFAQNYLYFDIENFLTKPFTHPFDNNYGRQYFLNYLFKTSLFGEFQYDSNYVKNIGIIVSFLFVFMLIYTIIAFCLFDKKLIMSIMILIFNAVFQFLSLLVYRMMVPAACNNDFRFIFPIIISTSVFYALSIYEFKKRDYKRMYYIGYILSISMVVSSLLFFFMSEIK
jgi:hypothetical protein